MARYRTIPPFTGTKDGVCIYRMHGAYFLRTASSLTAARVKSDPAFKETRRYSQLLVAASKIGSKVYSRVTGKQKRHELYRCLTGKAMTMLKEGLTEELIIRRLSQHFAKNRFKRSGKRSPAEKFGEKVCKAIDASKRFDAVITVFHSSLSEKIKLLVQVRNTKNRRLWKLKKYLIERSTDSPRYMNLIKSNF